MFPLENVRVVASNARSVRVGIFLVADEGIVADGVIPKRLAANSMLHSKRMVKEKRVAPRGPRPTVAQPFLAVKLQMRSNIPAAPMPPPMHMVTMP
jgi:hypothetical protein